MADIDLNTRFMPADWRRNLDLYLAERAAGMNGYLLARQRLASVAHLQSLSESELACMDLTRADIPSFVFEDILSD